MDEPSLIEEEVRREQDSKIDRHFDATLAGLAKHWFTLIKWMFVLGGMSYIASRSTGWVAGVIWTTIGISYILLYAYLRITLSRELKPTCIGWGMTL